MKVFKRILLALILLGGVGAGAAYYAWYPTSQNGPSFRTSPIERGDLLSTITATGTVEPEEVVDVGAQIMGRIVEFGPDPKDPTKFVDYGSTVEEGTVLAKIDPTPYEASLEQAEAALQRAKAELLQLEAKYEQAEKEWKRAELLRTKNAIAETDYDTIVANYKAAKANLEVGKASVRQNEAAVRVAKTNLGYTTIVSPVRGVILDRRVNIGQTVVASLNAPSLFLIAKDLRRMQVWASVNEADIGRIRLDMPVRFTVDAYPGETFRGKVTQIRLNATMTQNIVTYTVIVTTDNSNGKLLPYLTANVQFEEAERKNVLLAPNAALRWKPRSSQIDPTVQRPDAASPSRQSEEHGVLWVEAGGGLVRPVPVRVGITDGVKTEVSGEAVREGMLVVVGEENAASDEESPTGAASSEDKTTNPFLPKLPKRTGAKPPPPP
ncbi:MAG TPA: efflux RND transporter periplasmic adaptor subunit [Thermoguttaceae bacterium]|nr:efflux RND transporter periplasmic adaptor subunit [Thermoguttaceae bacterium]